MRPVLRTAPTSLTGLPRRWRNTGMPKRTDLKKILVIGSGPIVIGQAAEFDYAGTQACLALKEEGYEVILCNSNPATIMTDPSIADKVYMEPLTLEYPCRTPHSPLFANLSHSVKRLTEHIVTPITCPIKTSRPLSTLFCTFLI